MRNLISVIHARMAARQADDRGATMAEYGLMVALVALVAAVGAALLGVELDALFTDIANRVDPTP